MPLKNRIATLFPGRGSLGGRALAAGGWSLVEMLTTHSFRLVSNLVMTRLLLPEAFGLMALMSSIVFAFVMLTDIGIRRSIIREADGHSPHFLQAAWTVKLARGGLIAACVVATGILLWVFAPALAPAGSLYADPRLPILVMISALAPFLAGAESTNSELAVRNMENARITLLGIIGKVASIAAMISFAMISPTVWALMAGGLVGNLVTLVGSHLIFRGPRMRPVRDAEIADRLWRYGKWLMGSSAFTFVGRTADKFILAALLTPTSFGLYSIAQIWTEAGTLLISRLSDTVGFPAVSEVLRKRPHDLPRIYRRFQMVIDGMCLAAFVVTFLGARWLIGLLYTPDYAVAGDYLHILSITFLVLRFDPMNGLIMNMGNSRAMMAISALRAVAICTLLPLGFWLAEVRGALIAIATAPALTVPYTLALVHPVLGKAQTRISVLWCLAILAVAGLYVFGGQAG